VLCQVDKCMFITYLKLCAILDKKKIMWHFLIESNFFGKMIIPKSPTPSTNS
jgi:hypothetical protein